MLLLGKEPLHTPPQGLSSKDMRFCDAIHHLMCRLTNTAAAGPAPWTHPCSGRVNNHSAPALKSQSLQPLEPHPTMAC